MNLPFGLKPEGDGVLARALGDGDRDLSPRPLPLASRPLAPPGWLRAAMSGCAQFGMVSIRQAIVPPVDSSGQ